MATRAVEDGDRFLLTGRKLWITNAGEAGLFLLFANANPAAGYRGITAFLIEREFPGFQVGKKEDKLGLRASSTCELILDNCAVPKANVLGEVGKGYKIAIETLNEGRIAIGAQMIGLARGRARPRDRLRQAAQAVREDDRRIPGRAVRAGQDGDPSGSGAPAGLQRGPAAGRGTARSSPRRPWRNIISSEVAEKVASKAIEVFGGVGITKEYPVEKLYRDAKIGRIYEGTSNIQLVTIAKQLLGGKL